MPNHLAIKAPHGKPSEAIVLAFEREVAARNRVLDALEVALSALQKARQLNAGLVLTEIARIRPGALKVEPVGADIRNARKTALRASKNLKKLVAVMEQALAQAKRRRRS